MSKNNFSVATGFLVTGLVLLISGLLSAQTFSTVKKYGGLGNDYGLHVTVDELGNIYTASGFADSILIDGKKHYQSGSPASGIVITKHNAIGELVWSFSCGGDDEELFYIGIDNDHNVYFCTSFYGTQTFGPNTYTTATGESNDNMVMKLNADGTFAWSKHLRGPDHEHVQGMAVTGNGTIYITGFFDKTFTIEGNTLTNKGSSDVFVFKLDKDNTFIWAKAFGGTSNDWPWHINISNEGQPLIAGRFGASINWEGKSITSSGGYDMFIAKLDTAGSPLLLKGFGGVSSDEAKGVATDNNSNIYVSGYVSKSIIFGTDTLKARAGIDAVLIKFDPSGNYQWGRVFGGTSSDDQVTPPTIDQLHQVYLGVNTTGNVNTGAFTLTGKGSRDIFIAKFTTDGFMSAYGHIGGNGNDMIGDITAPQNHKLWITGRFASSSIAFGDTTLTNSASATTEIYIAHVDELILNTNTVKGTEPVKVTFGPVPCNEILNIDVLINSDVEILDINGKVLLSKSIEGGSSELNLSAIPTGVYIMKVSQGTNFGTYKIITE